MSRLPNVVTHGPAAVAARRPVDPLRPATPNGGCRPCIDPGQRRTRVQAG